MTFLALCFAVGALHAVMPDHWMPYSLRSWQRRRGAFASLAGLLPFVAAHLALGGLLFAVIAPFLADGVDAFAFSVCFVLLSVFVRGFRYQRIIESQRAGARSRWGAYATLSLLGPAESLVPILIQCRRWEISAAVPFAAYALGTLLCLGVLTLAGRWAWNRPAWLIRGLGWTRPSLTFFLRS